MSTPLRDQIVTSLSLYSPLTRPKLVKIVRSHDLTNSAELIEFTAGLLVDEGVIGMQSGVSHSEDVFFYREPVVEISAEEERTHARAARINRRRVFWSTVRAWIVHPIQNAKRKWGKR